MERRLLVLYGSQTFTAQEIAERAWRRSKALGFSGPVLAMDEYPIINLIHEDFALFVCATTGQGDEPDNMKNFWKFLLRKNLPLTSLKKLKFGVLALGDSSYAKYNYAGKKLYRRLLQLGATPLLDIGLCDYQHDLGHDAVLGPWLGNLWLKLQDYFPEIDLDENKEREFVPKWRVTLVKSSGEELKENGLSHSLGKDIYFSDGDKYQFIEPKQLKLTENKRTTSEDHFQDVRLLTFKMVDGSSFCYRPGDILNLRPRNSQEDIEELFDIFKFHNIDILPHYKLLVEELHSG